MPWKKDPSGRHETRWHNGQRFTEHVGDNGTMATDPFQPGDGETNRPTVDPPTTQKLAAQKRNGAIGALVVVAIGIALVIGMVTGDSTDESSGEDLSFGAMDVCEQFVSERLKAPSTADFEYVDPDDVARSGSRFTIVSAVDAENGFGAMIRTDYICEVRHVSGDRWRLVDLSM
jgi:hypothetical protein